jgi:hypothetical protein
MKRFYFLILAVLTCIAGVAQQLPSQIQAKRGVFTERLFLNGKWINRISTNLNSADSASDDVLATGQAIADFINLKTQNSIQNQFSAPQYANLWIRGSAAFGFQNKFVNSLAGGYPAGVYITHYASQHGLSIQRASYDLGGPDIVLFKNNSPDFTTLNALQIGDSIGTIIFSGVAGNNSTIANAMSLHGSVEKVAPTYLSSGFVFNTTDSNGVYARRLTLDAQGNLMIGSGTSNPYKLNVTSGDVRFNSLAGSGNILVASDNNGVLKKITLGQNLSMNNGILNANTQPGGYTKYVAQLSQSGQNNPSVWNWENTLGVALTWTRDSTGNYSATVPDGVTLWFNTNASDVTGRAVMTRMFKSATNKVTLVVKDGTLTNIDDWSGISVEIRAYTITPD